MAQNLVKSDLQFTSAIAKDTDTTLITGSSTATTERMINVISIVNNDAVSQTLTIKKKTGAAGVNTVWTDTITITTGAQDFYVGLANNVLAGNATNQELITVAFGTTMTASDTIDISCSVLEVS